MKQLYLFLLPLFLLIGCDKEAESPEDTKRMLQGFWRVTSDTEIYYDQTGFKIHALPEVKGQGYTFDGNKLAYMDGDDRDHLTTFTTFEDKGVLHIELNPGFTYEITQMSRRDMVWQLETAPAYYYVNQDRKAAPKSIQTITFRKE